MRRAIHMLTAIVLLSCAAQGQEDKAPAAFDYAAWVDHFDFSRHFDT